LKGTIPALVSRRVGSLGISDAEGRTTCPLSSKKDVKVVRI
jgi:hypothetical protein